MRRLLHQVLDVLVPQACIACDVWIPGDGLALCGACREVWDDLLALPACPRCARPRMPFTAATEHCRSCRPETFWNLRSIACCGAYRGPLRDMIRRHKFAGSERVTQFLGNVLAERLRREPWCDEIELFVPVPMHWLRRLQRPIDHAAALAEATARRLGRPVRRAAVQRARYAPSQTSATSRAQRFKLVAGSFAAARRPGVEGRTVCIIDNLVVSGATICEVAKVLRKSGARRIFGAILARGGLMPMPPADSAAAAGAPDARGLHAEERSEPLAQRE